MNASSEKIDLRPGQTVKGQLCYAEKRVEGKEPFLFLRVRLADGTVLPCKHFFPHSLRGLRPQAQIDICKDYLRFLGYEPGTNDWTNANVFCEVHRYKNKQTGKMAPCVEVFKDEEHYKKVVEKREKEAAEKAARDRARAERLGLHSVVF